jgi:tRNA A37 threonylcarbamoyladenosine biosynthesis protein TsaE
MSTDMIWQTSSTSSDDTERLGAWLGSQLKGGEVIELRSDLLADQLTEAIDNGQVVIVEWADVVNDVLPDKRLVIEFRPTANSPDERQIIFHYPESLGPAIEFIETRRQEIKP